MAKLRPILRRNRGFRSGFGPAPDSAPDSAPAPAPAPTTTVKLAPSNEELQRQKEAREAEAKKRAENERKYQAEAVDELRRARKELHTLNTIPKEQRVQVLREMSQAAQFYNACLAQKERYYVARLTDAEVDQQIKDNHIKLSENTSPGYKRKVLANYEAEKLFMDCLLVNPASWDRTGYVLEWRRQTSLKVEGRERTDRLVPPPPKPQPKTREQLEEEWLKKYPGYLVRSNGKLCVKFLDPGGGVRQIPLKEFAGYPDVRLQTDVPDYLQTYREIRGLVPTPSDATRKTYVVPAGDKIRVRYPDPNGKETITLNEFLSLSKNEIDYVSRTVDPTAKLSGQFLQLQAGLRQYVDTNTGKEQLTAVSKNYSILFGGDLKRSGVNLLGGNDLVIGLRVEDDDVNGSYSAKKNMLCLKVKDRSVPDIVATMGHEMQHALDDNLLEKETQPAENVKAEVNARLAGAKAEIDAKGKDGKLSQLARFYQNLCQNLGRERADQQFKYWLLAADDEDFKSQVAVKLGVPDGLIKDLRTKWVTKFDKTLSGYAGGPLFKKKPPKTEKEIFYEQMERCAEGRLRGAQQKTDPRKKGALDLYYDELRKSNLETADAEFKRILVHADDKTLRELGLEGPVKWWRTSYCGTLPCSETQQRYMAQNEMPSLKPTPTPEKRRPKVRRVVAEHSEGKAKPQRTFTPDELRRFAANKAKADAVKSKGSRG